MEYLRLLISRIISIVFLLLDTNLVISQEKACINNLPPFVHQMNRSPLLPVGVQVLVPSFKFGCTGSIEKWGIALEGKGEHAIHLQVWRPACLRAGTITKCDSYSLVGSNYFNLKPLPTEKLIYLKPDRAHQLTVTEGDVVGFYLEDSPLVTDDYLIQYRENVTGSRVMYEYSSTPYSWLRSDMLSQQLANSAPVITIYLDSIPSPTTQSSVAGETVPTARPVTPTIKRATTTTRQAIPTTMPTINRTVPTIPPISTLIKLNSTQTELPKEPTVPTIGSTLTPPQDSLRRKVLLRCALAGSVCVSVLLLVLVVMVVVVMCTRRRWRRTHQLRELPLSLALGLDAADMEQAVSSWSISETFLTKNPAYDHTHNRLVASLEWLPKRGKGKFQIWKAHDYETPVITSNLPSPSSKGSSKLERSYHHYECPTSFLQSSHHYEQI